MNSKLKYILVFALVLIGNTFLTAPTQASSLAVQLSGRILLQVQSHGEAWYVNPQDDKRYYLGRPDDAFNLMRSLSLGISEKEFASWSNGAPSWARGRLYIRPQSLGEAYYVDLNRQWHYLGRPLDAWLLLRSQGLGITNSDLAKIPSSSTSTVTSNTTTSVNPSGPSDYASSLSWKYNLQNFNLVLPLKSSLDSAYAAAPKVFYYTGNVEPVNAREQFYGYFFNQKSGDTTIKDIVAYGRNIAAQNSWTNDQTAAFLLAMVQYIPYDSSKLNQDPLQPNYPYETLYKDSGICSDKTFLAVSILRELGYGAAILDFPDLKHSAAGISCPVSESVDGTGYCYVETTNYFPVGVVPPQISGGQAVVDQNSLSNLFSISHLSNMQIFQKTSGLVYQGISATKQTVADLQTKQTWIETQKPLMLQQDAVLKAQQDALSAQSAQLNAYQAAGNTSAYNSLVGPYNDGVNKYNADLQTYRNQLAVYNNTVAEYNTGMKNFYQQ